MFDIRERHVQWSSRLVWAGEMPLKTAAASDASVAERAVAPSNQSEGLLFKGKGGGANNLELRRAAAAETERRGWECECE